MSTTTGCPARAGIGPIAAVALLAGCGLPRASGDRPDGRFPEHHLFEVAPRERG